MLADSGAVAAARRDLRPSDFVGAGNQQIFAAIEAVADRGVTVDPLTLADELTHRGQLAAIGGTDSIDCLNNGALFVPNVVHHAKIVVERAQTRGIERLLDQALHLARDGQYRPDEIAARVGDALATIRSNTGRFRPIDDIAVQDLPGLEYLVEGMIPRGGLAAIYGPPGCAKSFVALGLACSARTGHPWLGRAIIGSGPVVYIAAEGASGLRQRLEAWKSAHGYGVRERLGVQFVRNAANLLDRRECAELLADMRDVAQNASLIVIDTLHRSMPGGDENSAKDVGLVIENADRIRKETGATVLLVHHSRKDSDVERGSTSLRGAVDTLMFVKADGDSRVLSCEKQKDAAEFEPITFRLVRTLDSCVVAPVSGCDSSDSRTITAQERQALTVLSTHFLDDGATATNWLTASGVPEGSFWRIRTRLVREGYVAELKSKNSSRYTLSESGKAALAINSRRTITKLSSSESPLLSALSHPLGVIADESDSSDREFQSAGAE